MKGILIYLLGVISVSKFNERFIDVTAEKSDKSSFTITQYEAILQEETDKEKSVVAASNNPEITTNFINDINEQELLHPSRAVIDNSGALDPTELSPKLTSAAEAIVFASTNTVDELKSTWKSSLESENNNTNQFVNSFDNDRKFPTFSDADRLEDVQTSVVKEVDDKPLNESDSLSEQNKLDLKKSAPQHEDIPSFSEWTQKQLAEAEKKKTDENGTVEKFAKSRGKFRIKNYASPDCGAKIVASNPESLSSSSVLSSLKDEYMLNYCTNRIWFIVELCEAIQAKQLDLANFELFSSSPKHFSVSVSHRFPTRDWSKVGKFTAQDTRDVQTFNLYPHLFGKFVKVEMHSHYGREQFCPISWVGIYGTSEFEVLAKEDERNLLVEEDDGDSYDEDIFLGHKRDSPKNLFSSATDAVLSIVKKATAPFMKSESNETETKNCTDEVNSGAGDCVSPRYIIVCNNCTSNFYDALFHLLSCQSAHLERMVSSAFVKHSLVHGETCMGLGLDFSDLRRGAPFPCNFLRTTEQGVKYLTAVLKNTFVAALCNALAVTENKVVMNTTMEGIQSLKNLTQKEDCEEVGVTSYTLSSLSSMTGLCSDVSCQNLPSSSSVSISDFDSSSIANFQSTTSVFSEIVKPSERHPEKIEPTKTLSEDEVKMLHSSNADFEANGGISVEEKSTELPQNDYVTSTTIPNTPQAKREVTGVHPQKDGTSSSAVANKTGESQKEVESDGKTSTTTATNSNNITNQDSSLESIISDLNAIERVVNSPSNTFTTANLPAESIFLRLANRIKNLEINMSLSSTYLEELSRRYRMQLELISKSLNLTIQKVEEHSKIEEEKERRREKEILLIRMQLANLTRDVSTFIREQNSWRPQASSVSQHIFFISVEFMLIWIVFNYWKRPTEVDFDRSESTKKLNKKCRRRNSLEGVKGHEIPRRKTRRPSDEALDIALSRTYKGDTLKLDKKRKRKKKESKCSLNGVQPKRKHSQADVAEISTGQTASLEKCTISLMSEEDKSDCIPSGTTARDGFAVLGGGSVQGSSPQRWTADSSQYAGDRSLQELTSPPFMRTALGVRNSRLRLEIDKESSQEFNSQQDEVSLKKLTQKERKSSNSLKKYMKKFF